MYKENESRCETSFLKTHLYFIVNAETKQLRIETKDNYLKGYKAF